LQAYSPLARGPIYSSPHLDYQPSIIRIQPSGRLLVAFERIDPVTLVGDFYATYSEDGGTTWATPQEILPAAQNRRHPALLQLGPGSFALFYLKDTGSNQFRLFRATSTDGLAWSEQNQLDLGWATSGEINPSVIRLPDGTLTMTYHRLSGPSYIAQSGDGGATWDTLRTQISPGNAQLPRLAYRESDGLYLVTYQVGSSNLDMYSRSRPTHMIGPRRRCPSPPTTTATTRSPSCWKTALSPYRTPWPPAGTSTCTIASARTGRAGRPPCRSPTTPAATIPNLTLCCKGPWAT
jgi:hypothetical protein